MPLMVSKPLIVLALVALLLSACGPGSREVGQASVRPTDQQAERTNPTSSVGASIVDCDRRTASSGTHRTARAPSDNGDEVTFTLQVVLCGKREVPEGEYVAWQIYVEELHSGDEKGRHESGVFCGEPQIHSARGTYATDGAAPCRSGGTLYRKSLEVPVGATLVYRVERLTHKMVNGVMCPQLETMLEGKQSAEVDQTLAARAHYDRVPAAAWPKPEENVKYTLRLKLLGEVPEGDGFHVEFGETCREGEFCPGSVGWYDFCGDRLYDYGERPDPCKGGGTVYEFKTGGPVCGIAGHIFIKTSQGLRRKPIQSLRDILTTDLTRTVRYRYPSEKAGP